MDTVALLGGPSLGGCDMLIRTSDSTQHDRMPVQDSYSDKCAVGIAAIWIGFYAFIGIAAMVGHGVSATAALQ